MTRKGTTKAIAAALLVLTAVLFTIATVQAEAPELVLPTIARRSS